MFYTDQPFSRPGAREKICRCAPAFTLIEMLVVISIIAILMALLLPSLNRTLHSARSLKCLNNLHQVASAQSLYLTDNRNRFQLLRLNYNGTTNWNNTLMWADFLLPYTYPEVQVEPRAYSVWIAEYKGTGFRQPRPLFNCPEVKPADSYLLYDQCGSRYDSVGLGMNGKIAGNHWNTPRQPIHLGKIKSPGTTILYMDMAKNVGDIPGIGYNLNTGKSDKFNMWAGSFTSPVLPFRHGAENFLNVICVDGSASSLHWANLPTSETMTNKKVKFSID